MNDAVHFAGNGHNNDYLFTGRPGLAPELLQNSLLDGGNSQNGKVDFSGYGNNTTDLTFTIEGTTNADPNQANGIGVSDNDLVFPHIYRVKEIVGGQRTSTFQFHDAWDANLVVGAVGANSRVTLDFTQLAQNFATVVAANGTVQATDAGSNRTVAATAVSSIQFAGNRTTSLDLSAITAAVTIRVAKIQAVANSTDGTNTRITISTEGAVPIAPISIDGVRSVALGDGRNKVIFENGAVLPAVSRGGNNTVVELDYRQFGNAAAVNLGDAPVNLTDQPQRVANNMPHWGTTTYQLVDLGNNGINTRFSFGGRETTAVLGAANIRAALLNLGSVVKDVAVTNGANAATKNIQLTTLLPASQDALLRLNASASVMTWADVDDTTKHLAVDAASGTFRIQTTINANAATTDPIDVAAARGNANVIVQELNDLIQPNGINAAVTGHGTAADPWVITWVNNFGNNGFNVVTTGVDATGLVGVNPVTLVNTVPRCPPNCRSGRLD